MSRSYRLAAFCSLACSLIIAAPLAVIAAVERGFAFLWALLPTFASESWLVPASPTLAFDAAGAANDPALLNSLRHEAGMRRLT